MMTHVDIFQLLLAGGVVGFLIGLTGVGGGVLLNPTLTTIFHLTNPAAVATAALFAMLTKSYAAFQHARLRNIAWKECLLFLLAAVPGAGLTSFLVSRRAGGDGGEIFNWWLGVGIIAVISLCLAMMIYNTISKRPGSQDDAPLAVSRKRRITGLLAAFSTGLVMGATGIGGGVLVIPILLVVFRLQVGRTVGSSVLVAEVLCVVIAVVYALGGAKGGVSPEYRVALLMALGSLIGVWFGSKVSVRLPERQLKFLVVSLITVSLVWKTTELVREGQQLFGAPAVDVGIASIQSP